MKITALVILKTNKGDEDPIILAKATDLASFSFWYRSNISEFVVFTSRTIAKCTQTGQRLSVQHGEFKVHPFNRDGLCALGFMDDHYPLSAAFSVLKNVMDEYLKTFGYSWRSVSSDNTNSWPLLDQALSKYQDPTKADKLLKLQDDLDKTKIILHKTIDSLLVRGEKLDNLVEKSRDLTCASKTLYRQSNRDNQCCTIL